MTLENLFIFEFNIDLIKEGVLAFTRNYLITVFHTKEMPQTYQNTEFYFKCVLNIVFTYLITFEFVKGAICKMLSIIARLSNADDFGCGVMPVF